MLRKLRTLTSRKKAVIFDYDGVLNDSFRTIYILYNEFYKRGISNMHFSSFEEFRDFFHGDISFNMQRIGIGDEAGRQKSEQVIRELLPGLDQGNRMYDGIEDAIKSLHSNGYKIGIVSNSMKEVIDNKLRKHGLEYAIAAVIGHDEIEKKKPHPEGILKCLNELYVKPKNAVYVGDMATDIKAARAAGIKIIVATYGYEPLHKLSGGDAYINHPSELCNTVRGIIG